MGLAIQSLAVFPAAVLACFSSVLGSAWCQETVSTTVVSDRQSRLEIDGETNRTEFEVLATNIGHSGQVTLMPETNSPYAPFSLYVCELSPQSRTCLTPESQNLVRNLEINERISLLVSIQQNARIFRDSYDLRVWLRVIDQSGSESLTEAVVVRGYVRPVDHGRRLIMMLFMVAGSILFLIFFALKLSRRRRRLARGYASYYRD